MRPCQPSRRNAHAAGFSSACASLLIFTLIVAIACAWLGRKITQKRREREAVEAIIKAGGTVVYDYQKPSLKTGRQFKPVEEPNGPALLRVLLGENFFSDVYAVHHYNASISDDELELLQRFPHLEELNLSGGRFSAAGMMRLGKLTSLQSLCLGGARPVDGAVPDLSFEPLSTLTQLEILTLSDTTFSDRDLVYIRGLNQLTTLFLHHTNVTDAGLDELKGLVHLTYLSVSNPNVTTEGEKRIREAFPQIGIGHPPQPTPKSLAPAARAGR